MSVIIAGLLYISLGSVEASLEVFLTLKHRHVRKSLRHLRWALAVALGVATVVEGCTHIDIENIEHLRSFVLACWRTLEEAMGAVNGVIGQLAIWRR